METTKVEAGDDIFTSEECFMQLISKFSRRSIEQTKNKKIPQHDAACHTYVQENLCRVSRKVEN